MANIKELFGDSDSDSDEDNIVADPNVPQQQAVDVNELFGSDDSDSDDEPAPRKPPVVQGRLKKGKAIAKKQIIRPKKRARSSEGGSSSSSSSSSGKTSAADDDDQGEYDSGEEVTETDADREFIDRDDDLADIAKEYHEEKQKFDDEAPIPRKQTDSRGSTNIIDIALEESRRSRKKRKEMEESEKRAVVASLLEKMDTAWRDDLDARNADPPRPALHKLSMLDVVENVIMQRNLHDVMLDDHNILEMIRNWLLPWPIEDEDGNDIPLARRTLPSYALRTKMYELLSQMDRIRPEHLKGSERGGVGGDAPGLGKVVMMLYKHPQETRQNKAALKEIMEEWSRAIFKRTRAYQNDKGESNLRVRSMDVGGGSGGSGSGSSAGFLARRASSGTAREDDFMDDGLDEREDSTLKGREKRRVNVPIRTGFNFKVKPKMMQMESVNIGKNTEKKAKLATKLKEVKRASATGTRRGEQAANKI